MVTVDALQSLQVDDVIYYRPYSYRQVYDKWGNYSERCNSSRRFQVMSIDLTGQIIKTRVKTARYYAIHNLRFDDLLACTDTRIIPQAKTRKFAPRSKSYYAFSYSDGGKAIPTETNDCTVRALAIALDAPYTWAHEHMRAHGRQERHGGNPFRAYPTAFYNGKKLIRATMGFGQNGIRLTVNGWIKSGILPERAILSITGHVFAVVNGVVMDTWKPGARHIVDTGWEVVEA